eukprot:851930-Rhodomonas_salina.2
MYERDVVVLLRCTASQSKYYRLTPGSMCYQGAVEQSDRMLLPELKTPLYATRTAYTELRNQMQETAFLVQIVMKMRFHVFDFGVYAAKSKNTREHSHQAPTCQFPLILGVLGAQFDLCLYMCLACAPRVCNAMF